MGKRRLAARAALAGRRLQGHRRRVWRRLLVSALPGGQVAVVHGTSSCASRWSQFAADVVAPASGSTAQRAVFHSENSYVLDDNPIRFKVRPDGFEVRATVGSMDSDVMTRPGIFRYRVDGDTVQRVQPVALNGRDFVDEWLKADDALAREWSEPAAAAAALKGRQAFDKASKVAGRGSRTARARLLGQQGSLSGRTRSDGHHRGNGRATLCDDSPGALRVHAARAE